MARYKSHVALAAAAGLVVSLFFLHYVHSPLVLVSWLFWSCVGGLFPDIDTKSKGQKLFYFLLIPLFLFFFLRGWFLFSFVLTMFALVPLVVNHRGMLHSFWFLILFPTLLACMFTSYKPSLQPQIMFGLLFFCVGAFSHLWLDFGFKRMFSR